MNKKLLRLVKLVFGLFLCVSALGTALGEEFYKGKTIRIVVGFSPGGSGDTHTRAAARHMSRYIPGDPTFVVQNMSAGGSSVAANYIYNEAKPDGLTLGVFNIGVILQQALGDKTIKIDGRKLNWIGGPGKSAPTCGVMGFTGLKTLKDVLNSKKPIKMGGSAPGVIPTDLPRILNLTLGTKFDVITGYVGVPTMRMFMQRRELDGICLGWEGMKITARALLDAKGEDKLIPFIIHNRWDDPEVKDLPLIPEAIKARGDKKAIDIYNVYVASLESRFSVVAPPGVAKERIEILRKAYKATLKDPQFLAEAKKSELDIHYASSEEIYQGVDKILGMTPEVKEALQVLVQQKK